MSVSNEMIVRRYLLGIAGEAEQREVDDAVLAGRLDAAFLAESEDALIDEYCSGRLSAEEHRGYIDNFLVSPQRRERHAFGVALTRYLRNQPLKGTARGEEPAGAGHSVFETFRKPSAWKPFALASAAACVLLASLVVFGFTEIRRDRQTIAESRNELARMRAGLVSGPTGTAQPKEGPRIAPDDETARVEQMPVFSIASATRSIEPVVINIPAGAHNVGFEVSLPSRPSEAYVARITQAGTQLWAQQFSESDIHASGKYISVVPASVLLPGVYHFKFEKAGTSEPLIDQVLRVKK